MAEEMKNEEIKEEENIAMSSKTAETPNAPSQETASDGAVNETASAADENGRLERDAAAMAREKLQGEEKEQKKRLKEEEKQKKKQEKKEVKAVVKQERKKEWKSLWHTAELALLVTFVVLAIDQAGVYGFLFVWLFVAVMVASVALLLLGLVRTVRKKRSGIIFLVAVIGIIGCTAWFIFLVSSQGLGLGPVPN